MKTLECPKPPTNLTINPVQIFVLAFLNNGKCFPFDLSLSERRAVTDLIQKMHGGIPKLVEKELPLRLQTL